MPPNGTTGKSSSAGARGPTGPQGQARTSPAGSGGGKAGSVSRTSSGARGPTGPGGQARSSPAGNAGGKAGATSRSAGSKNTGGGARGPTGPQGQARTSPAGGKPGTVSRAPAKTKTTFEQFQARYPGGLKTMPVKSIPAPMPGGFGPAGNVVRGLAAGARNLVGRALGSGRQVAEAEKRYQQLEKMRPGLERMKQSEAIRLGKTSTSRKLPDKAPPMKLRQIREANKPIRGFDTWSKIDDRIDDVTEALGFGKGAVARAQTAATAAGVQEVGREVAGRIMGADKYKKGGLVSKKGRVAPKGMK